MPIAQFACSCRPHTQRVCDVAGMQSQVDYVGRLLIQQFNHLVAGLLTHVILGVVQCWFHDVITFCLSRR